MISQEKWTPLQKLPKNVEDLGQLTAVKGLKKLPKVQKNRPIWSHYLPPSLLFVRMSNCVSTWIERHLQPNTCKFFYTFLKKEQSWPLFYLYFYLFNTFNNKHSTKIIAVDCIWNADFWSRKQCDQIGRFIGPWARF